MKRELLIVFFAVSIIAATFFITNVHATDAIGRITSDATWTKANSLYTLTGSINVNTGVTLTIDPSSQSTSTITTYKSRALYEQ